MLRSQKHRFLPPFHHSAHFCPNAKMPLFCSKFCQHYPPGPIDNSGASAVHPEDTCTEDDYMSAEPTAARTEPNSKTSARNQTLLTEPNDTDPQPQTDEERTTRILSHVAISNLQPSDTPTQKTNSNDSQNATTPTPGASRVPAEFSDSDAAPFTVFHGKRSRRSNTNSPETKVTPDKSQPKRVKGKSKKSPKANAQLKG